MQNNQIQFKPQIKKALKKRLNIAAGHFSGVEKMFTADREPIDIVKQNQAIISAIKKINKIILSDQLEQSSKLLIKKPHQAKKIIDQILEFN